MDPDVIIKEVEKNIPGIQGVYLFGSFVSGNVNEDSDIDIAILSEKKLSLEMQLHLAFVLGDALHRDVDLVELRYVNTIFQEEILKTSKRIATYNKSVCDTYEDYIYCSAMDFREFRKPHVDEILSRGSVYG